ADENYLEYLFWGSPLVWGFWELLFSLTGRFLIQAGWLWEVLYCMLRSLLWEWVKILKQLTKGPIPWAVNSEIYPQHVRGLANGVATTVNWSSNLIVSLTFLSYIEVIAMLC